MQTHFTETQLRDPDTAVSNQILRSCEIGRASCRERVLVAV